MARLSGLSNLSAVFCLFWLFSSTALAASAVLGIDFGTEYIKAALVKPGIPLEIVLTKDSRRKETSAVAFKPVKNAQPGSFPERVYGSDAIALAARFPGDVYPNLKALLGLPADNSKVKEYAARHPALKLDKDKTRGTAAFRSGAFVEDEEAWIVEEILAMELQSIQRNAEALAGKGSSILDLVVTVPPYFGAEEKRAIQLAADLAGLRILSLISDGLAVGLNYATARTFPDVTEGGKPEHHLVFDMGAGSTKATVLQFQARTFKENRRTNKTVQEVRVLGTGWDRTLGGDALNAVIVDQMIASFVDSKAAKAASITAESVQAHGRAAAKLWKEAERLRQVLSANADTQAGFEGLFEDVDFRYKLSRADFEKFTESFAERVAPVIEAALDKAKLEISDLDSIIVHGGASRTPFIQKQLEKIIGSSDKLRSNVNADEAAVFGAAFKGAGLSPSFRVKDIKTYEAAGYAVGMKWQNIHEKPQHQQLYLPQSSLGVEKMVSFQNQKDFSILFYQHIPSGEDVSPGSAEKEIVSLTTKNLTATIAEMKEKNGCADGDILAKFGVRLNPDNGEVEITKAVVHCEVEEDPKAGGVVDGVKGLFGFGSKKSDQDVFKDADIVADVTSSTETTSSTTSTTASSEKSSKSGKSKSSTSAAAASSSAAAKDEKPKKRLVAINLDFEVGRKGYPVLSATELIRMKDRLVAFGDSDRSRMLREEALNQLEAFTYKVRDLVEDASFIEASTAAERSLLEEKSMAASEWLYGDGADARREELREKLKELKDIVAPVDKRRSESKGRPEQIKKIKESLEQTESLLKMAKAALDQAVADASSSSAEPIASPSTTATPSASGSAEDEFAGLEDETATTTSSTSSSTSTTKAPPMPTYNPDTVKSLQDLYDSVSTWLSEKIAEQEALMPTADPVLLLKDMALKANELSKANMALIMDAMKVPPPPKSSKTPKTKKTKTAKTKKAKGTKSAESNTEAEEDPKPTLRFEDQPKDKKPVVKFAENGEMPSEEEILEMLELAKKEREHKVDEL